MKTKIFVLTALLAAGLLLLAAQAAQAASHTAAAGSPVVVKPTRAPDHPNADGVPGNGNGNGNGQANANGQGNNSGRGHGNGNGQGQDNPITTQGQGNGNGAGAGPKIHYSGEVIRVDGNTLTLALRDGLTVTLTVSDTAAIRIPGMSDATTLANLRPGVRVKVHALAGGDGGPVVIRVHVTPGKPIQPVRVGVVTAYTPGVSITIESSRGVTATFALSDTVEILPPERAGELEVGRRVTVIAPRDPASGDDWVVQKIVVHPEVEDSDDDDD